MPVYCGPEAPLADPGDVDNPDPNEAALIVGVWMGGNPFGNPLVTESLAREKLSFLLRTDFAGVAPGLLDALKRIEPNTKRPPKRRGPRTDWQRKAAVMRFIHERLGYGRRGDVWKAIKGAARQFDIQPEGVWKIWNAHRDDTWMTAPIQAAAAPISPPPAKRRRP